MLKGFIAGLVVANAFEWFAHKYVLHGTHRSGKPRFSPVPKSMKSHWEHHREVRKTDFYDHGYVEGVQNWRTKNEILSLVAVSAVFVPLFYPISKGMSLAVLYSACNYYYIHRRAHLEPEWAMKKIPWHYDHHMNSNQDANWCVTKPWFDYILGTRVISSAKLQEQNPLGVLLPTAIAKPLSHWVNRVFPAKWVAEREKPAALLETV
ncbi:MULTISPECIES: sterol desaturase family protein [unclassified Acinetobacter]|uniref:sterol desaturase family protein n=1 Tax=unclassified Acinetobacter TaxID=196816 RepID=UPI0015D112BD|nr:MULTISPECIES: sterol desaturase family protein [unclassified Acinetobacter]